LLSTLSIAIFRASTLVSYQATIPAQKPASIDTSAAISSLSLAIQCATTHDLKGKFNQSAAQKFWANITVSFPRLHQQPDIKLLDIDDYTVIYKWEGRNPAAPAVVLFAAYDLPEPALANIPQWQYNPFLGKIADGYIWGCGTMRSKTNLVAILAAMEQLSNTDFVPARPIIIIASHDQHSSQIPAMRRIAAELEYLQIPILHILAAGSQIRRDNFMNLPAQTALINIADQQQIGISLTLKDSSWAESLKQITNFSQPTNTDHQAYQYFLEYLSPELSFTERLYFANRWLADVLVRRAMSNIPRLQQAQSLHFSGLQVLPATNDSMNITFALQCPQDWAQDALLDHIKTAIPNANIAATYAMPAPLVANPKGKSFELLQTTIKQLYPNTYVLPTIADRATGTAFLQYQDAAPILQFSPFLWDEADYLRYTSGIDERISIDSYIKMIQFYTQYLRNANI
jgi:carboxypeptidase PM20D1